MSQDFDKVSRKAVILGATAVLSCAIIFAGFGPANLSGLKRLSGANCNALEAIYTEDFEKRTQPILDPWGGELKRSEAYRVIAESPPALSGHWFEQISGKFAAGESARGEFLMRVDVPLERETRITIGLRSATGLEMKIAGVVRSKNGATKLFEFAPQAPSEFGVTLSTSRSWVIQGTEDVWSAVFRWLLTMGEPADGARLVAVGISFDRAEFDANVDDIIVWQSKACADSKTPFIADLCSQPYFVSVVQDFEDATTPVLNSESSQNAKIDVKWGIETGNELFDGKKYEFLKFKFQQEAKGNRVDFWLVPTLFSLSDEVHASISYSGPTRPAVIARVDFGGGKSGEMYSGANGVAPLTGDEKRKSQEAAAQGWNTMVTPDIRAWALDMANKQNWKSAEPRLVAIGIEVGGLQSVDIKLDHFIVYLKQPQICKQFTK